MEFPVMEAIQRSGKMKWRRIAVQPVKPQVSRQSVMHLTRSLGTADPYRAEAHMLLDCNASVKIETFICRCGRYDKEWHKKTRQWEMTNDNTVCFAMKWHLLIFNPVITKKKKDCSINICLGQLNAKHMYQSMWAPDLAPPPLWGAKRSGLLSAPVEATQYTREAPLTRAPRLGSDCYFGRSNADHSAVRRRGLLLCSEMRRLRAHQGHCAESILNEAGISEHSLYWSESTAPSF